MSAGWCLLAAVASMVLYGLASVAQAAAARRASGPRVLAQPLYVVGLGADALAWAASVLALVQLPLVVVQPLLAGSVAVAVLLAVPLLGARLVARDGIGVALTTAGLVLVSLAAGEETGVRPPHGFTAGVLAGLAACALLLAVLYRRGAPVLVAALAGLAFAGAALAGRAVVAGLDLADVHVLLTLAREPLAWALAAYGVVGSLAYARALERGGLGLATATMWLVEALLPAAVGVAVLGDAVRPGWSVAAGAGALVAVAGCVVLAFSPAQAALTE